MPFVCSAVACATWPPFLAALEGAQALHKCEWKCKWASGLGFGKTCLFCTNAGDLPVPS